MAQKKWTGDLHPCQSCGACCTIYRVSFDQGEIEPRGFGVPRDFVELGSRGQASLCFRAENSLRCKALQGQVGHFVGCQIYENRPSPCRSFRASFEDGDPHSRCDKARARIGLLPLTLLDWEARRQENSCVEG